MEVVFYNGNFILARDVPIHSNNRAFNYGDGFFESIKIINAKPFNFSFHMKRLNIALSVLKLSENYSAIFFLEKISHLLELNKILNGSVKIHISRSGAGKYLPESNNPNLLISTFSGHEYQKNHNISLCFYNSECKTTGSLSNIKSFNCFVSILASIYANENNFDNAIIFNSKGNVIEVANANIFFVRNQKIYTPSLSEGCVDGTMREWAANHLDIIEKAIFKDEVLEADEIFIANAISGFTSVHAIEGRSYSSFTIANYIQQKLINLSLDL